MLLDIRNGSELSQQLRHFFANFSTHTTYRINENISILWNLLKHAMRGRCRSTRWKYQVM